MLDDEIKANAMLSADCLTESRKWIDKNAAEANASRIVIGRGSRRRV